MPVPRRLCSRGPVRLALVACVLVCAASVLLAASACDFTADATSDAGGGGGGGGGGGDGGDGTVSRDPAEIPADALAFSGMVYDEATLAPIGGALVSTDPPIGQIRTNGQGLYVFAAADHPSLAAGQTYTVRAERPGYLAAQTSVLLGGRHLRNVDLPLRRAAPAFKLTATPGWLDFTDADFYAGETRSTQQVRLETAGEEAAEAAFSVNVPPEAARWLDVQPKTGTVGAVPQFLTVQVDRAQLPPASPYAVYRSDVGVVAEGGVASVLVTLRLGPDPCGDCAVDAYCDGAACVPALCEPSCAWRQCGVDGCGNSCGTCPPDLRCEDGRCRSTPCERDCAGRVCGDDGCGGSCGACVGDETCSAGRCVPPGGPTEYTQAVVEATLDPPTGTPRALAVGDGALWVGDTTRTLWRVDPASGAALGSFEGPATSPIDLTTFAGTRLYAAYADGAVYRVDTGGGGAHAALGSPLDDLRGLAADRDGLLTWEGGRLVSRDPDDFATRNLRLLTDGTKLLAHGGGALFAFGEATTADHVEFTATVVVLDPTGAAAVDPLGELRFRLDASLVLGLAADGDTLWVLGGGVGANANRIVRLRLR